MKDQLKSTSDIENLGAGVTREWLHDGQIVVFALEHVQREAVDTYIDTYMGTLRAWSVSQPFLMLLVAQQTNIFITPYFRKRLNEAIPLARSRKLHGRLAVVVLKNPLLQVVRLFIKANYSKHRDTIEPQLFFTREEALVWLEEMLES